MNSELDRTHNPHELNDEFEAWLDEMYARADAERVEQAIEGLIAKFPTAARHDNDVPF